MSKLVKKDESGNAWYPVSINKLESLIGEVVYGGRGYDHSYALRKNLAYNLQYIEFQDRLLQDIKLSSVLYTQTIKTVVLVGAGIIESILYYLLIISDVHSTTEWKEKIRFKGNQKKVDEVYSRVDTILYEKLAYPEMKHMSFDAMIKCAKSNNIFGSGAVIYSKLDTLRCLRNKVHLQIIDNPTDTDWNNFNSSDLSDLCKVIHAVFTSSIFSPDAEQRGYFSYLRRNFKS